MQLQGQLCYLLSLGAFLTLLSHSTANVLRDENSLNSLYNNLLQREYAGPIVFPNHQVERKAQRSPSLRLRFGRRSDPDLLPQVFEKRWFGDVNQKPIRSPSLRLRFGRRSDPSMPMHSPFDILMNGQQTDEINNDDYNDLYGGLYDRVIRKAQRLRFGRSQPFSSLANTNENNLETNDNEADDINEVPLLSEDALNEFERAIRSVPLRLRWGRSTGGRNAQLNTEEQTKNDLEQKYQNKESITTAAVPLLENDIDEVKRAKRSIQEQKDSEDLTLHLEDNIDEVKREKREPPPRLRWGRSIEEQKDNEDILLHLEDNLDEVKREKREPPPRLRWGRSIEEQKDNEDILLHLEDNLDEVKREKREPPPRLRWGRSADEQKENKDVLLHLEDNLDEVKREKREPPPRLRWGRSADEQKDNEVVKTSSTSHLEDYKVQVKRARRDIPVRLHFGHGTDGRRAELNSEELPKYDLEQKKKVTELTNDVDNTDSHQNQD